ncbi:MAG: DUF3276 family protein [candidate division WOR-3 bacterium]
MEQRKDDSLYSKRVKAGRRVYFIDVKQNKKGNLYLAISEKRKEKDGSIKRTRVIVFEEDILKFEDAFNEVIVDLKSRMGQNGKGA